MKAVSLIDPSSRLPARQPPAWLESCGSGIIIKGDPETELDTLLGTLTAVRYSELQRAVAAIPTVDLVYTAEDHRRFTAQIAGATSMSLSGLSA